MRQFDHREYNRRSIRLKEYDYSQPGMYFLTMCTKNRECLFGEVKNGEMVLNDFGEIAKKWWRNLENKFPNISLDEYKIMPNHLHGIINVRAIHESPVRDKIDRRRMLLPKTVGYFKMNSAKDINKKRRSEGVPVWQRNYYEYIIRDEESLDAIRNYIINNSLNWNHDSENPNAQN